MDLLTEYTCMVVILGNNYGKTIFDHEHKHGINNPLFLRTKYRAKLSKYTEATESRNPVDSKFGIFKRYSIKVSKHLKIKLLNVNP